MDASFVTILFTDLVGSTRRFERHGDDAADAVRRKHFRTLRRAVADHQGREVRSTGDGLMVAFSSAVAAVRCAVDMQRATTASTGRLELRVGLDAGEPLPDGEDLYGTPVIVAGRLCSAAAAGEILASDVVCRIAGPRVAQLMEPLGALRLQGVSDRVSAARVRWQEADEPAPPSEAEAALQHIRVVLVDDERLLRTGFRVILEHEPDIEVVGEAADGRAAIDVVMRRRPDVVLMDIRMPELDGLKAAERILSEPDVDTAVLMLTTFDRDEYVYEALRIGVSGFLLKTSPPEQLLHALRTVAQGNALIDPKVTRRLIEAFGRTLATGDAPPELDELSPREREVLELLARGLSNAEIAKRLYLSQATVKTHVARVLMKLRIRDRVQAVVFAYETGVASTIDPLAGSYYVEALTDEMEAAAEEIFAEVDSLGGVVPGIERGYFQREIARSAMRQQREIESADRIIVGVNEFTVEGEELPNGFQFAREKARALAAWPAALADGSTHEVPQPPPAEWPEVGELRPRASREERREAQSDLDLPPYPTTTTGSLPQTAEVRQLRVKLGNGELDRAA
ncbi:MAG: response regulator, partial [Actinobacteria bacterium]|nr:response regulator [Actinomycetota bacterium]